MRSISGRTARVFPRAFGGFCLLLSFWVVGLAHAGSISGTVRSHGAPILFSVSVTAYPSEGSSGRGVYTAEDGTYTISGLSAGTYKVLFNQYESGYESSWYQNRANFETADLIDVPAEGVVGGIDGDLRRFGGISGRVTLDGVPLPWVNVNIYGTTEPYPAHVRSAQTDSDGRYSAPFLKSGRYKVEFSPPQNSRYVGQWYQGKSSFPLADPVEVSLDTDAAGIDADLARPGRVVGRVTSRGWPLAGANVRLLPPGGGDTAVAAATTDATGNYVIAQAPVGRYHVVAGAAKHLDQWYPGGRSAADAELVSVGESGEAAADFDLVGASSISGTVTSEGQPLDPSVSGIAELFTDTGEKLGYSYFDPDHRYFFGTLAPGNYKLHFKHERYVSEWFSDKGDFDSADTVVLLSPTDLIVDIDLAPMASISGTVLVGGSPRGYVSVEVYDEARTRVGQTLTGADGTYRVRALPAGSFRVRFGAGLEGYSDEWYRGAGSFASATPLVLGPSQEAGGIDADLVVGGEISGRVTFEGAPAAGAGVSAIRSDDSRSVWAQSGADGTYRIVGVPTGSYKVSFGMLGLQREWFNDRLQWELADPVSVTAPEVTSGVDADLIRAGSISGRVTVEGVPTAGLWVTWWDGSFGQEGVRTAADGTYLMEGLQTGSYRIRATQSEEPWWEGWYDDKAYWWYADPVAVNSPLNTPGIDIDLRPPGAIRGTVTVGGVPKQGVSVSAWDTKDHTASWATSAADGTYSIPSLRSGTYRVRFGNGGYQEEVQPVWYRGRESYALADPVMVGAPAATSGIDVDLVLRGSISGTVTAGGAPVAGAYVSVWERPDVSTRAVTTGADGRFTIPVVSGVYRVRFWKPGYVTEWYPDAASYELALPLAVESPASFSGIDGSFETGGSVTGTVTSDGLPVAGVPVILYDQTRPGWSQTVTTDYDGKYLADRLPAGDYLLFFDGAPRTLSGLWYQARSRREEADPVSVPGSGVVTGLDADLTRGGSICGRTGEDVPVSVQGIDGTPVATVVAAGGIYCVSGLPTGSYMVSRSDAGTNTWYNNKADFAEAGIVLVSAPYATVGIDIARYSQDNAAPTLDPIGDRSVLTRIPVELVVSGKDADGDALVFGARGLPPGATFEAASRTFLWTPADTQTGSYRVTFTVTDNGSPPLSDIATVTIRVSTDNWPPRLDPIPDQSVMEGNLLEFRIAASDPDGDPLALSVEGLPLGASFDTTTGWFTWRPGFDQGGEYAVTFLATDSRNPPLSDAKTVIVTVRESTEEPIFLDRFSHGRATKDPDWMVLSGKWSLAKGLYNSNPTASMNLARVRLFDPIALPLKTGIIQAWVKLVNVGTGRPNALLIFAFVDKDHYRYVRLRTDRTEIGQKGMIGGELGGVKRKFSSRVKAGRNTWVTVLFYDDGWTFVFLGEKLAGYYQFRSGAAGGIAIGAARAKAVLDALVVWDDNLLRDLE